MRNVSEKWGLLYKRSKISYSKVFYKSIQNIRSITLDIKKLDPLFFISYALVGCAKKYFYDSSNKICGLRMSLNACNTYMQIGQTILLSSYSSKLPNIEFVIKTFKRPILILITL
jgi:hypothetical protein